MFCYFWLFAPVLIVGLWVTKLYVAAHWEGSLAYYDSLVRPLDTIVILAGILGIVSFAVNAKLQYGEC